MDVVDKYKESARVAIRRGAAPGKPIPKCRCFQDGAAAILSRPNCNGVCEDAVDWVAKAISAAVDAAYERAAKVAEAHRHEQWRDEGVGESVKQDIASSIRSLKSGDRDHG